LTYSHQLVPSLPLRYCLRLHLICELMSSKLFG
jgi:hypothetical protein